MSGFDVAVIRFNHQNINPDHHNINLAGIYTGMGGYENNYLIFWF